MGKTRTIGIAIPTEQLAELDSFAAADRRSRSGTIAIAVDEFLARHRAAGRKRLAAEGLARANAPRPGAAAGAEHLAEHRRLCGFDPPSEKSEQT